MSDQSLGVKSSSGTQMKKKIFRQQKVIKQDALDLFIPDPSAKTFVACTTTCMGGLLFTIRNASVEICFRISAARFLITGFLLSTHQKFSSLSLGFHRRDPCNSRVRLISRASLQIRPLTVQVNSCCRIDPWSISWWMLSSPCKKQ